MSHKTDYLETVEIFQDLSHHDIEEIGQQTTLMNYKSGHIFYMPDDTGEVMYILKKGRVQLYRMLPDGRKLIVSILQQGTIFGQMALVGQHLHNTFAEALDDCLICVWSRHAVERLLIKYPRVAIRFLDAMGQRLFESEQRLEDATYKRIPARLAGLLLRLNHQGGHDGIVAGYTHQSLADLLGTYRETTTQTLNDFKSRNLIRTRRKFIEILDEESLSEVASM
jgi:CRP/FNR family transcriptional regulator, cyclic AMP receptor protein